MTWTPAPPRVSLACADDERAEHSDEEREAEEAARIAAINAAAEAGAGSAAMDARAEAIRYLPWLEEPRHADPPLAPFHWEIEFPEVFDREIPGFDAFVGNPPFAGKNSVAASNVASYPRLANGIVQEIKDDKIVRLPGSYFAVTGIAHFSHCMLEKAL